MWYFSQLCINTEIFDEMKNNLKQMNRVVFLLLLFAFIHFVFVLFEQCFFVRIFLSQCNKFLFKFNQHQNKPKSQCNVCQQISVDRWLCWQIWMIRRNIAQFNITTYRLNYQQINKTKKGMYGIFICLFHIEKLIFQLWKWLVLLL